MKWRNALEHLTQNSVRPCKIEIQQQDNRKKQQSSVRKVAYHELQQYALSCTLIADTQTLDNKQTLQTLGEHLES